MPMLPVPNQITQQNINIDSSMGQINVSHRINGLDNMTLSTPAEGSLLGCMPICVLQSSAFNCDKQRRKLQRERERDLLFEKQWLKAADVNIIQEAYP